MSAVDTRINPEIWLANEEQARRSAAVSHARSVWAWRILSVALFLGSWQFAVYDGLLDPFFTSSPVAIARYLGDAMLTSSFWTDVGITLLEALVSFGIGSLGGILCGFLLAQSSVARDCLRPFLVVINSMPRVALAPLLIIWFGLGIGSKIAVGISLTFFVVLNGTLVGVDSVDPDHKLLSRQLGLGSKDVFCKVVLPSSVVSIFAALNLALIYGFLGVVVTEMLASPMGLGHLLQMNAGLLRTDAVLGIVFFLALLVAGLVYLLDCIESALLKWRTP